MLTAHLQTTYVWILHLSSVQFFNNFSASEFDFVRCLIICRYLGFFSVSALCQYARNDSLWCHLFLFYHFLKSCLLWVSQTFFQYKSNTLHFLDLNFIILIRILNFLSPLSHSTPSNFVFLFQILSCILFSLAFFFILFTQKNLPAPFFTSNLQTIFYV